MATEVKRITLRRGTTAEWNNANPLLEFGEIGVEVASDGTVKFKMGDSSNSWANLPYFESGSLSDFIATAEKGAANGVASLNANSLIPLTQLGNATTYTNGEISGHNSSTTNVHGISNTANLATKEYVDNVATGITAKPSVKAASTANIEGTYDNGTNGVNSTITATVNGEWPGIDDITSWSVGDGLLLKDQTDAAENGRWVMQSLGSSTTPWILRRCSLCDESDEIPGMYIFVVSGTQNAGTAYVALVDDPDTFTVGVDDINMTQFAGGASLSGGSGIILNGTEISIDPAVVAQLSSPTFSGEVVSDIFFGELFIGDLTGTADNAEKIDNRKFYVQSSQPSSGMVTGDIWIKTI